MFQWRIKCSYIGDNVEKLLGSRYIQTTIPEVNSQRFTRCLKRNLISVLFDLLQPPSENLSIPISLFVYVAFNKVIIIRTMHI